MADCRRCGKPVDVEDSVLCRWCATHEPAACQWCGTELTGDEVALRRVDSQQFMGGVQSADDGRDDDDVDGPWCCDHCRSSQ